MLSISSSSYCLSSILFFSGAFYRAADRHSAQFLFLFLRYAAADLFQLSPQTQTTVPHDLHASSCQNGIP
ncbi:hypothetical protein YC2023_045807 [Brassica napus]